MTVVIAPFIISSLCSWEKSWVDVFCLSLVGEWFSFILPLLSLLPALLPCPAVLCVQPLSAPCLLYLPAMVCWLCCLFSSLLSGCRTTGAPRACGHSIALAALEESRGDAAPSSGKRLQQCHKCHCKGARGASSAAPGAPCQSGAIEIPPSLLGCEGTVA